MSFKEFDLSDYIHALEDFKSSQQENIVKYWGSLDNFEMFIQKIRDDEDFVARLAVQEFGSVEKYTETMKHNLEHFSEIMEDWESQILEELKKEDKFAKLASYKDKAPASEPVQELVREILAFTQENAPNLLVGTAETYCRTVIDAYSGDFCRSVFDAKNGDGASAFVAEAFRCYLEKNCEKNCPH